MIILNSYFVEYVIVIVAKRFEGHIRAHNIYENDEKLMKKVELDKLFESSSPADVLTALVKRIKVLDDFHYRPFNNVTRGCRLCNICECEFRERNELNDHSRDHNKHGGSSYYIETDKFEVMLEEVSYRGIVKALLGDGVKRTLLCGM